MGDEGHGEAAGAGEVGNRRRFGGDTHREVAEEWETWILAGGLSRRMGRDKRRLKLAGKTMLRHAFELGRRVTRRCYVVRRDDVERCGPVGGMVTAAGRSGGNGLLYLPVDMPLLTETLCRQVVVEAEKGGAAAVWHEGKFDFPVAVCGKAREGVVGCFVRGDRSIQQVLEALGGRRVEVSDPAAKQLVNVNTETDWQTAVDLSQSGV